MKLKQTLPYKLKRIVPILGLAGASLFTACEEPDLQHDTIYNWNIADMSAIYPTNHAAISADSAQVRTVFLNYTETPTPTNVLDMDVRTLMEKTVAGAKPENQYKIRGSGEIPTVHVTSPEDSAWVLNFGFKVRNFERFNPEDWQH